MARQKTNNILSGFLNKKKPKSKKKRNTFSMSKKDKDEFRKCMNDAEYFIDNYCWIKHPTRGTIKFKMYDFQKEALKRFQTNRLNAVLKSRQLGLSTLIAAFIFWCMLFKPGYVALVMANKEKTAKNVLKKIRLMITKLEKEQKAGRCMKVLPWYWNGFERRNVTHIEMPNGSEVLAEACTEEPGRSEGVSLLCVDEAGIIPDLDDKWGGLAPIITTGGACILNSTPRGALGKFYGTCINGVMDEDFLRRFEVKPTCHAAKENRYNLMIMPYDIHPERDEEWLEQECKDQGFDERQRAEEFFCNFLASGQTYFSPTLIKHLEQTSVEPIRKEGPEEAVWIWEDPVPDVTYLMTVDVAEGAGKDYSTMEILKAETCEIVLEYKGKYDVDIYDDFVQEYAYKYNTAGIIVENNGIGRTVIKGLKGDEYPSIYYTPIADDLENIKRSQKEEDKQPHAYFFNPKTDLYISGKPGLTNSPKSRPLMLSAMAKAFREKTILTKSIRLVDELKTFVWDDKKTRYEAPSGANDDLVMSIAFMCYVYQIVVVDLKLNQAYAVAMLQATSKNIEKMPDHLGGHDLRADAPVAHQPKVTVKDVFKQKHREYHRGHETHIGGRRVNLIRELGLDK